MHHICYEVTNINDARAQLEAKGARVLGDGTVKTGAHGNPVLFCTPRTLTERLLNLNRLPQAGRIRWILFPEL